MAAAPARLLFARMIDRRELAEALGRLDPRDREVLDYSLRRHVPDNDLAGVFDCGPSDVARMRAAAVERLADDLDVQRGSDLGHVLTALLDHSTWDLVPPAEPLGPAVPAADAGAEAGGEPSKAPPVAPPSGPQPERGGDEERQAETPQATTAASQSPGPLPDVDDESPTERRGPVLGMLAPGYERPPDRRAVPSEMPPTADGSRRWSIAAVALIAVLATIGLGSVLILGGDVGSSTPADEDSGTRPFVPQREAVGEPFPSEPESAYRYPIAVVERASVLLDEPGGKPKVRIAGETEWDSPRVLGVVERRGDWLAVLAPELENGEVGWIHDDDVDRLDTVGWALKADLSKRLLEIERDGEIVRRVKIGVGREDHPTPIGRYAVTDKLSVTDPGSPYGCCVVALTGHQTRLPEGWPGGDRLAIHATSDLSGLGHAVSLGCMRSDPDDARWMMDSIPLGTPVFVSA